MEMIRYVRGGLMNKEIAFEMGIEPGSVKVLLSKIYDKAGLSRAAGNKRVQLATYVAGLENADYGFDRIPIAAWKGSRRQFVPGKRAVLRPLSPG